MVGNVLFQNNEVNEKSYQYYLCKKQKQKKTKHHYHQQQQQQLSQFTKHTELTK